MIPRSYIRGCVLHYQKVLRLQDVKVEVRFNCKLTDAESLAEINSIYDADTSRFVLEWSRKAQREPQDEIQKLVVHELLHITLWPVKAILRAVKPHLDAKVLELAKAIEEDSIHLPLTKLADIIAELVPYVEE